MDNLQAAFLPTTHTQTHTHTHTHKHCTHITHACTESEKVKIKNSYEICFTPVYQRLWLYDVWLESYDRNTVNSEDSRNIFIWESKLNPIQNSKIIFIIFISK